MEYASKAVGNAGLTTGIIGTALGAMNSGILPNLLGGAMGANYGACAVPVCNENIAVNRYEAAQSARIAELETEVKLRDANTYTDQKMLEIYKYFDGKIGCVEGQLAQQAVYNATNTATLNCMSGQIAQLMSLTKLVIPNGSVCPGWGEVTVTPAAAAATTA